VEQTIGVFGEEMLLWMCVLRHSPQRPPPDHVHRQANFLLDELKASKAAAALPVQSADDGAFVIAAIFDEWAMSLPDLRPIWSSHPLQATRWTTNNAGVEVFTRVDRVRQGPKTVLATYVTVLGLGFLGRYGLPGVPREQLFLLRRELGLQLGIDADRDWKGGALQQSRPDQGPAPFVPKDPWHRSLWFGRGLAVFTLVAGFAVLAGVLAANLK
jgi:type VI secretion system protein ImpK